MSAPRLLIGLLLMLCVSGCTHFPKSNSSTKFTLLSPDTLSQTVDVLQEVEFISGKTHLQFQAAVHVDGQQLQIVTLNNLGQRLFSITQQGHELLVDQAHLKHKKIDENDLVRDIQWLFWPLAVLNKETTNTGWRFNENGAVREVYYNDQLIATLNGPFNNGWQGEFSYQNHAEHYQLHVKSTPYE